MVEKAQISHGARSELNFVFGLENVSFQFIIIIIIIIIIIVILLWSRDSSVSIALGYGLDDRGSRVRFPAGAGNLSLHHRVQNGSGAHPASYPTGNRGSIPGGKAAGACS
jgi:hypothetical protein